MASALTVLLLGSWLAGRSRVSGAPDGNTVAATHCYSSDGSGDTDHSETSNPVTATSEPSSAQDLTRAIIAGVSAATAGLLLLLLIFLCYRRKGRALRQSRESEATSTIYALVGERKQLDVLPQEPDPGANGLTYAKLNHQALQAKQGGPARQEPILYAVINVSQEPVWQSPQGAGGALPPPP